MNKTEDLMIFTKKLACFTRRGVPLCETISNIRNDFPSLQNSLDNIITSLKKGVPFWKALEASPPLYPVHIMKIIQAGEQKEILPQTLEEISSYLEEQASTEYSIRNTILSFAFHVNLLALLVAFLAIFILPYFVELFEGFAKVFEDMDMSLPLPTKIVINLARSFRFQPFPVLYVLLLIIFNILIFYKDPIKNTLMYYMPIIGNRIRKYYIFQIARTGGMLLERDIPLKDAFLVLSAGINMEPVRNSLKRVIEELNKGKKISTIFEVPGIFPRIFCWLMMVGEGQNNLQGFLTATAAIYKEDTSSLQIQESLKTESVFAMIFGFIIGFIVISVYLPMYQLIGAIR